MLVLEFDFLENIRDDGSGVFLSDIPIGMNIGKTFAIKHEGEIVEIGVATNIVTRSAKNICHRFDFHPKTESECRIKEYVFGDENIDDDIHCLHFEIQKFPELGIGDEVELQYESQISKNLIETKGTVEDIRSDGVVSIRDDGQSTSDLNKRRILVIDIMDAATSIQYRQKDENNPGFQDDYVPFGYDWDSTQKLGTLVKMKRKSINN